MGRRSAAQTVIAILTAFVNNRSWKQADLARRLDIRVPALRSHLLELQRLGVPLEDEREHPHVIWSVPNGWFPGAVSITAADALELLRHLARSPQTPERDRLLLTLAGAARKDPPAGVQPAAHSPRDEDHLRLVEDAHATQTALTITYYSAHRGDRDRDRTISVQRVVLGPLPRVVAHCHRSGDLRYFRISRIESAALDPATPYISVPTAEVDAFIATSVSGYRDPADPVPVSFTVQDPHAHWVKDSTPFPMQAAPIPGGLRLTATTSGVLALARYIVGLGPAARAETPELLTAVHELAQGSLAANSPPLRSVEEAPTALPSTAPKHR